MSSLWASLISSPEVRRNVYFFNFIMLFSDENGATLFFSLLGFEILVLVFNKW